MLRNLLLLGGLAWVLSFRDLRMFKWEQLEERPQRGAALLSRLTRLAGLDFQSFSTCPASLTLSTEHASCASSYPSPLLGTTQK